MQCRRGQYKIGPVQIKESSPLYWEPKCDKKSMRANSDVAVKLLLLETGRSAPHAWYFLPQSLLPRDRIRRRTCASRLPRSLFLSSSSQNFKAKNAGVFVAPIIISAASSATSGPKAPSTWSLQVRGFLAEFLSSQRSGQLHSHTICYVIIAALRPSTVIVLRMEKGWNANSNVVERFDAFRKAERLHSGSSLSILRRRGLADQSSVSTIHAVRFALKIGTVDCSCLDVTLNLLNHMANAFWLRNRMQLTTTVMVTWYLVRYSALPSIEL